MLLRSRYGVAVLLLGGCYGVVMWLLGGCYGVAKWLLGGCCGVNMVSRGLLWCSYVVVRCLLLNC